jgi:hypothetical protein
MKWKDYWFELGDPTRTSDRQSLLRSESQTAMETSKWRQRKRERYVRIQYGLSHLGYSLLMELLLELSFWYSLLLFRRSRITTKQKERLDFHATV